MKKALKWIVLSVFALVLIVGGIVFFGLNRIVRTQVEKGVTQSLKVQTTLASANVSPFSGTVELSDLDIASPAGFTAPKIFRLGNVSLNVKYSELTGDPVRVTSIRLAKPKLVLEYNNGSLNVKTLMDNLKDPTKPSPEPDPNAKPLKLTIDELIVDGAEVEIRPGIPGLDKPITLTVPTLTMNDIGTADGNKNGEEIGRVALDVMGAVAKSAASSDRLPPEVRALLNLNVDQMVADLSGKAREQIDQVKQQVQETIDKTKSDLTKHADETKKNAEKGLNDLLGGKNKRDEAQP